MKNTVLKAASLLLCLFMLLPLFAACGGDAGAKPSSDPAAAADNGAESTAAEAVETADPASVLSVPEKDFDGRDFMIAYIAWALYNGNIISDAETGDTINDAVYQRTIKTEEKANVKLHMIDLGKTGDILPKVSASVMAGDDAYQLVMVHCISGIAGLAGGGLVENWNDIPYVDFSKNWWKSSANENLSINGIQTHVVSEFIRSDPVALLFNLGMIGDYSLEDPYELLFDGKWTWGKLSEMSLAVSKDVNGDGVMDVNDQYGFVGSNGWEVIGVAHSCGQLMMEKDSDGVPQIVFNNEKMHSIVQMFYDLLYDGKNRAYTWKSTRETDPNIGGTPPVNFGAGHALFYQLPLTSLPNYRATEIDFGVLPFPKYDEKQDSYYSLDWSGMLCVPRGADTDLSGYVTELLSYFSMDTTVPAWYDILLTDKITRDENSVKSLDIIYGNLVYDFGLNYSEGYTTMLYAMSTLMGQKSSDFAAFYTKNEQQALKHYEEGYQKILENYGK